MLDAGYHGKYNAALKLSLGDFGLYGRDPSAMHLLTSMPGILAGLRMVHQHERCYGELALRQLISDYLYGGG